MAINFVQRQGWDLRSWGARKVEEKPGGPSFRAAAILLRPANQAAGNAEQPYRGSTPSTLEHGSIARRDQPFDAREKHPPLSRERLETRSSTNNNAFRRKLLFFFSGRSNNSSTILQFSYLERERYYIRLLVREKSRGKEKLCGRGTSSYLACKTEEAEKCIIHARRHPTVNKRPSWKHHPFRARPPRRRVLILNSVMKTLLVKGGRSGSRHRDKCWKSFLLLIEAPEKIPYSEIGSIRCRSLMR